MKSTPKDNIIRTKTFQYAVIIVRLCRTIQQEKKEYILSKQLLRCSTSIGANVEEADGGISKADFSNKISIAYKESKESHYWLRLMHETELISTIQFNECIKLCDEINKILFSILKTTRINTNPINH